MRRRKPNRFRRKSLSLRIVEPENRSLAGREQSQNAVTRYVSGAECNCGVMNIAATEGGQIPLGHGTRDGLRRADLGGGRDGGRRSEEAETGTHSAE